MQHPSVDLGVGGSGRAIGAMETTPLGRFDSQLQVHAALSVTAILRRWMELHVCQGHSVRFHLDRVYVICCISGVCAAGICQANLKEDRLSTIHVSGCKCGKRSSLAAARSLMEGISDLILVSAGTRRARRCSYSYRSAYRMASESASASLVDDRSAPQKKRS